MKKLINIALGLCFGLLLVGCQSNEQISRQLELETLFKKDMKVYFNELMEQISLNDYSATLLEHQSLVDQETQATIFKGDRIAYLAKDYPNASGVHQIVAEYSDDNQLLGIKVDYIHPKESISKEDEVKLCEAFIEQYELATSFTYLTMEEKEDLLVYKFKVSEQDILKIYVNQPLNTVVGFLHYDGMDL